MEVKLDQQGNICLTLTPENIRRSTMDIRTSRGHNRTTIIGESEIGKKWLRDHFSDVFEHSIAIMRNNDVVKEIEEAMIKDGLEVVSK